MVWCAIVGSGTFALVANCAGHRLPSDADDFCERDPLNLLDHRDFVMAMEGASVEPCGVSGRRMWSFGSWDVLGMMGVVGLY